MNTDPKSNRCTPFQFTARADWEDGKLQTEVQFTLAPNKRLVIEYVSAELQAPKFRDSDTYQEIISTQICTQVNGAVARHAVHIPRTSSYPEGSPYFEGNLYSGGQPVRIYADARTAVKILVHKNSDRIPKQGPKGTTIVYLSGHLEAVAP